MKTNKILRIVKSTTALCSLPKTYVFGKYILNPALDLFFYKNIFHPPKNEPSVQRSTRRPGNWQLRVREINPLVEIIGFTNGVSRTGPKGRSITLPMTS